MNVSIRRLSKSNVTQRYVDWLNDPEINQFIETRLIPQTLDDCIEYVEGMRKNPNQFHFGIFMREGEYEYHVGNIKLGPVNWIHRNADVSIFIGESSAWGKGIGYQAIMLLLDFGFNILNLHRVNAHVYQGNERSERLFKKCGFSEEGVERGKVWLNGNYINVVNFGKLREDYDFGWKDSLGDRGNRVFRQDFCQSCSSGTSPKNYRI